MKGVDMARDPGALAGRLKAAGLGFAAGYYSYNERKNLTPEGARALTAAGLSIVSVFEAAGNKYSAFNASQGHKDALQALKLAQACGQPEGSGLYFAVDYDASPAEIDGGITEYFKAVRTALGARFRIGVYGSGMVCDRLDQELLAELFWLGGAMGWRGSRSYSRAHIRQGLPGNYYQLGVEVDPNTAIDGDFGQWQVADVGPASASENWIDHFKSLQRQLAGAGFYHGTIDGVPGPLTFSAMTAAWRAARAG